MLYINPSFLSQCGDDGGQCVPCLHDELLQVFVFNGRGFLVFGVFGFGFYGFLRFEF